MATLARLSVDLIANSAKFRKDLDKATKHSNRSFNQMAKKAKGLYAKVEHQPIFHKTSIGRNPSLCKMNKHKRRSYKKYRGQGR